jgi:hypothetical protein
MWKYTAVVDADPVIVFGVASAGITCFKSIKVDDLAARDTAEATGIVSISIVKVADEVVVFTINALVTTVVVLVLGTVYRVALVVAAAVLASAFDVTAISYCILSREVYGKD